MSATPYDNALMARINRLTKDDPSGDVEYAAAGWVDWYNKPPPAP